MLRSVLVVCVLSTNARAQPTDASPTDAPQLVEITAEPAPSPSTPPSPLPPPPSNAPSVDPSVVAQAKPPPRSDRFLVALGLSAGAVLRDYMNWRQLGATAEIGVAIPRLPMLRARLFGAVLRSVGGYEPSTELVRLGIGLEVRRCEASGNTCVFGDLDVARQQLDWFRSADTYGTYEGVAVGLRLGLDVGGRHVRMRLALELDRQFGDPDGSIDSVHASFAVGYQL